MQTLSLDLNLADKKTVSSGNKSVGLKKDSKKGKREIPEEVLKEASNKVLNEISKKISKETSKDIPKNNSNEGAINIQKEVPQTSSVDYPELTIDTVILVDENDFNKAERDSKPDGAFIELCENARNKTFIDIWNDRHDIKKAGIGADSVKALFLKIKANPLCRISSEDLAGFTRNFFCDYTEVENILSCRAFRDSEGTHGSIFIYPLNKRQLNLVKWIDGRSRKLKTKIKNRFIDDAGNAFGLNLNASMDQINLGHTQKLDDFPKVKTTKADTEELFYDTTRQDDQIQCDFSRDKMEEISKIIIKDFTTGVHRAVYIKLNAGALTQDEYIEEANLQMKRDYPDMTKRDRQFVLNRLRSAALGFYVLDDLINDKKISDIKITGPDKIRVKVQGQRCTSNLRFIDYEDYRRFLDGILSRYGRDPEEQIHVFTDKFTNDKYILRNNITLEEINSDYPTYHIRKVPKEKYTIDELINLGVMDRTVANYLIWAARNAKGMVFTGKGSSGKTTMMNTLLEETPSNASGLVIQESEELFTLTKPELTFEHITGKYDLKELAKNGLLTDIDYFIIGEVKGDEAMYFINACDTGNKGWCSVHSPSSRDAIDKLADYVMYASKYDKEQALYMLKELQVIVFMKNFKVAEISEVVGWDPERKTLKYDTIFKREIA